MTSNLLGISVTGLKVSQANLRTAGHNIANAGVEGYSRQRVDISTATPTLQGGNYVGNGANVESINRIVNQFITEQLRTDTSLFKGLEAQETNISFLDGLLADSATGLSSAMESFFSAMQNGADDPTSIPARELIISESENLAKRFNTLYSNFQTIENSVDDQLSAAVSQVNAISDSIAKINLKISEAMGSGGTPNDLLDQREEHLRNLSELVSLQTYDQGNGQINVVIGSGQNLVVGIESRELMLVPDEQNPTNSAIVFKDTFGAQVVTDKINGGEIGGLLTFRDSTIAETYNQFGRIAVVMADTFNDMHEKGIDLNNEFGGLFFYDVNDPDIAAERVIGNANNAPPQNAQISLLVNDSQQITVSDYEVTMVSDNLFRIERLSDGEIVSSGVLPGNFPFSTEFDGLELVFNGGALHQGDAFTLEPVKTGGRDFSSMLVSPSSIAFASPVLTDASLGNQGTGEISPGEVLALVGAAGNSLPLFNTSGEMNPPLLVRFNTPSTYDILDNSDPGNPIDLDPPVRNQRFIPGVTNNLFSGDPGATMVSTEGELTGLPSGRSATSSAALQVTGAVAPNFAVSDFSGANQFSFELNLANTLNGINDTTVTVTVSDPAITSEAGLLQEINSQLSGTDIEALIVDDGTGTNVLTFRSNTPGYGDITLQNYTGPAGPSAADNLFGFAISTAAPFTTVGGANGVSGIGAATNGYPAEAITITQAPGSDGVAPVNYNIFTGLNASARQTASALNDVPGVSANAFTYAELSNFQVSLNEPLQVSLNGENLLEYVVDPASGNQVLAADIPSPQTDALAFQQYLADRINNNANLSGNGIYATAAQDSVSGNLELRIYATQGDDLDVGVTASANEYLDVSDGENNSLRMQSTSAAVQSNIVVGGKIDVSLAEGLSLRSFPPVSMLFGDTSANDFAQDTFLGIQASISGIPQSGDLFTLSFNNDAASDNRNALGFVGLEQAGTIEGGVASYSNSYASLVEKIGIDTSSININKNAAEQVLIQSTDRRDSISAVNLDEEAANLIRFEQMFSANAQVISVARDLFDRLISSL